MSDAQSDWVNRSLASVWRPCTQMQHHETVPLILRALEQTYDHVVVAAPPLGKLEEAGRIAGLGPTLILVTHPGARTTDAVQAFDALAARGFGDIAMVTFAEPAPGRLPHAA